MIPLRIKNIDTSLFFLKHFVEYKISSRGALREPYNGKLKNSCQPSTDFVHNYYFIYSDFQFISISLEVAEH